MSRLTRFVGFKAVSKGVRLPESQIDRYFELAHLRELLTALHVNCFFDVGANCGQFVRDLRGIGFRGRIVSFEPVEGAYAELEAMHRNDPLWTGYRVALGSAERKTRIHVHELSYMSSLLGPITGEQEAGWQDVEVKRLDAMYPAVTEGIASPRVFMKTDTQGFDLEVFRGASGCLDEIVGLQAELSVVPLYDHTPGYLEQLAEYERAGFHLYNLAGVSRVAGGILETNCFMSKV